MTFAAVKPKQNIVIISEENICHKLIFVGKKHLHFQVFTEVLNDFFTRNLRTLCDSVICVNNF